MPLQRYEYTRNAKTGKRERTGNLLNVGNVSRAGGGYTQGIVSKQDSSGNVYASRPISNVNQLGVPVYSNALMGAPNYSSQFGPAYAPPTANIPFYMENNSLMQPNTSTENGPVYNAPPSPTINPTPESTSFPSSSPNGSQEALNQAQNGVYQSFEQAQASILGNQGAAAPITADDIIMASGFAGLAKSFTEAALRTAATAAEKISLQAIGKKGSLKLLQNMESKGAQITTQEGMEALASNLDEAGAIVKSTDEVVLGLKTNTKTFFEQLKVINGATKQVKFPLVIAGGLISLVYGLYKTSKAGEAAIDDDLTAFSKSFVTDGQKLRDAGYNDTAEAVYQCAEDVRNVLESGGFSSIFGGKQKGIQAVNKCKNLLYEGLIQVEKDNAARLIAEEIAAQQAKIAEEIAAAQAKTQEREDQQAFQTSEREARQDFETREREARQDFQTQSQTLAYQQQLELDATETEISQGSTLQFGLLGTSGAREFVNKDKAAAYYFDGKTYDELTPAQKLLLNLLKGKGGD